MTERTHFVVALSQELLGPRYGVHELLAADNDPRDEYILGVLAPDMPDRLVDPDADADELIEEVGDDENQGAEGVVIAPPSAFSPALDPKAQPRSLGLSFIVHSQNGLPSIDICVTWARYERQENGAWLRCPNGMVISGEIPDLQNPNCKITVGSDVDVHVRWRPQRDGSFRVSIYLVNTRSLQHDERPATKDFVFQPQIRVHCLPKTTLLPVLSVPQTADPLADEDQELAMLYRDRAPLARGHLCGATWHAIDPERPLSNDQDTYDSDIRPTVAPFSWTDSEVIEPELVHRFSPADVRTEFLPCYPVESPDVGWPLGVGETPELRPDTLADIWDPAELKRALTPLVDGYITWIERQITSIPNLRTEWHSIAQTNLDRCQEVAQRMRDGIDWLLRDTDVRLAFCFANKAIAVQSSWTRQGVIFPWRPFQLAFLLLNIQALANPRSADRRICDLLWFPTGGGKTEAYLALAAFSLALRRRRSTRQEADSPQGRGGVGVLSRYTLRLLTIQQFRRALAVITACEYLRVLNLGDAQWSTGWRPAACPLTDEFLWGGMRFSIGLWVGGGVTPNDLLGKTFPSSTGQPQYSPGAIDLLAGVWRSGYSGVNTLIQKRIQGKRIISAQGEPAQVLNCPTCATLLAIPKEGIRHGIHTLHLMVAAPCPRLPIASVLETGAIEIKEIYLTPHSPTFTTISIALEAAQGKRIPPWEIDRWWKETLAPQLHLDPESLVAASPARPGYVLTTFQNGKGNQGVNGFEIYCPNPKCVLNTTSWAEQVPISVASTGTRSTQLSGDTLLPTTPGLEWQPAWEHARHGKSFLLALRMPIPAVTTDDQIYHRCPSMVIATVDKFARLAYEPKASSIFGHVTHYHARWGYYREGCPPPCDQQPKTTPHIHPPGFNASPSQNLRVGVQRFSPPDLIIQDELHLLEGPLGSMVGLYETAVDALCEQRFAGIKNQPVRPKYVASTATVRQADSQVQSLFDRKVTQFPPSALTVDDRFFARTRETHPLEASRAGRLYMGITAPGKGAQTPIVRIWSALLQTAHERYAVGVRDDLDQFWTLVGYFNALRELAGAAALYRQDVPQRMKDRYGQEARSLPSQAMELSSRANSLNLPGMLSRLERAWSEDVVLATSMFGTGVDVDRLGLMVVHGQPKTTSAYIQATGRVGRQKGGLVLSFFRASRPRDLDHYEFFTGYHRMLYRAVEPITVTPYAPRARERGLGPLAVVLLRHAWMINGIPVEHPWRMEQRLSGKQYISNASLILQHRHHAAVKSLPVIFEQRAQAQPDGRQVAPRITAEEVESELDRWMSIATDCNGASGQITDRFVYAETTMLQVPTRGVVLGDAQHQMQQLPVVFENAPNSLRDVEETTQFQG